MASIKRRPDGIWRARYRDEAGREHAKHFPRKVDAQRWLDEVTASVVTGNYVDPKAGKITFKAFFDGWAARQVWVRGTTQAMTLTAASATFADVPLKAIRRSDIEAWVKTMNAAGLAPGTVATRVNSVRAVFRAAHRDKIIGADPTEGITLPRRRRAEVAMTIPSPADVGKLLGAAETWFSPLIGLCAFAGLRLGEAAGVQLGDVDFLRRTLTVSRQVQRAGGTEVEIRAPKYGSERVIYLELRPRGRTPRRVLGERHAHVVAERDTVGEQIRPQLRLGARVSDEVLNNGYVTCTIRRTTDDDSNRSCRAGRRESSTGGTASLSPGRVPGGYPEEPAAPTRRAGNQVVGVGRVCQDLPVLVAATPLRCPRPSFTGHDGGLLVSMRGPTAPGASMTYTDADSTRAT